MRSRTRKARWTLVATTLVWFVAPTLGRLFEADGLVRAYVSFVGSLPLLALLSLAAPLVAGTLLYPRCKVELRTRTVLPLVCLVLGLWSFTWILMELWTDDMAFVALAFPGAVGLLLLVAWGFLLFSRHFTLAFTAPALVAVYWLSYHPLLAFERARDRDRGERIVEALTTYRERTGAYPHDLQGLVPEDLDEVPRPNRWFWRGARYHYRPAGFGTRDVPTSFELSYPTNGDFDVGCMRRTPFTDWTWVGAFEDPSAFEHPGPTRIRWLF